MATPVPATPIPAVVIPTATATPTALATATSTVTMTSTPSPTGTAVLLDETMAKSLIQRYYDSVNARDFAAAYALLGAGWRQRQKYDDFEAGYARTARDIVTITGAGAASKDGSQGYLVTIDLLAEAAGRAQRYKGLYFVGLEATQPKIQSGELTSSP